MDSQAKPRVRNDRATRLFRPFQAFLTLFYRRILHPPGRVYELHCWLRGRGVATTAGIIGVCSDVWGNEAFSYAEHGDLTGDWREITFQFHGPAGGRLNLIIRNSVKIDELALDDMTIVELP